MHLPRPTMVASLATITSTSSCSLFFGFSCTCDVTQTPLTAARVFCASRGHRRRRRARRDRGGVFFTRDARLRFGKRAPWRRGGVKSGAYAVSRKSEKFRFINVRRRRTPLLLCIFCCSPTRPTDRLSACEHVVRPRARARECHRRTSPRRDVLSRVGGRATRVVSAKPPCCRQSCEHSWRA